MLKFRTRKTQRLRLFMGGLMFAALAGVPLFLALTRPSDTTTPAVAHPSAYAQGLDALGVAALVALPLALIFCPFLTAGQAREVSRRYLAKSARTRRTLLESARTLAVIFGSVG